MPAPDQHSFRPYIATSVAWGSVFFLVKLSLNSFTPIQIVVGRSLLGAVVVLALLRYRREQLPRSATVWGHVWVVSLLASVIPGIFVAIAETRVTSALTGIFAGMIPLATLLFLVTVFREERVHPHQVAGLGLGFVGLIVITGIWQGSGRNAWWAIALLLATVISYGAVFPYIKRYLSPLDLPPLALASSQQIAATVTTVPFLLLPAHAHHGLMAGPVLALIALGVFAGGMAFKWNFETVADWGSSVASTVEYVCAVVAGIEGVALLHESLRWYQPVGGVIIIVAALIGWGYIKIPGSSPGASS